MQRKSFFKLLLSAFLHVVMGNAMCMIMTISLAAFIAVEFTRVLAVIFSLILFYSLIFNAGYKDGLREKKMLALKRTESLPKNRWIKIGFAAFGITVIPSVFLLINKFVESGFDFMIVYRFISGAVYALALLTSGNSTAEMPVYAPFVFILFYAFIPLVCQVGFNLAQKDNLTMDRIIYKQK